MGYNFHWYKKYDFNICCNKYISKKYVSIKAFRDYLECANIYKGTSPKKKTYLIEMIIYGCITQKLNKREVEDISIKQANQILNKNNITLKSLPGYGNMSLKKKEIKSFVKEKTFINVSK